MFFKDLVIEAIEPNQTDEALSQMQINEIVPQIVEHHLNKQKNCFKKLLLLRDLLVSLLSRTDSSPLRKELEEAIDYLYELSREI